MIPGDPRVRIRYGHVNGDRRSGIATQGANAALWVLHFSLIKH